MRFGGPVTTFLIVRRGKSTRNESPVSVVGAVPMGIIGIMPVSRSRVCIACLRPVGVIHLLHSRSFLNSRKLKLVNIATHKYFGHHAGVRGQRTFDRKDGSTGYNRENCVVRVFIGFDPVTVFATNDEMVLVGKFLKKLRRR